MRYGDLDISQSGTCSICRRSGIPVILPTPEPGASIHVGVCEPCARLADWRFRRADDAELAGAAFPTAPGAALVLVVRDRLVDGHPDTLCPRDVLMVERKLEPGVFGLPGGKIEEGEPSDAAAVRELAEETGVVTWPTGLEPLYCGFSPRGRLVRAFLCRAHGGAAASMEARADGSPLRVEWKPWPPSFYVGQQVVGYYGCLQEAFDARLALHAARGNEPPLCQHLGKSAMEYVSLHSADLLSDDTRRHIEAMSYVMSEEEKLAAKFVLRDALAPKLPEVSPPDDAPELDDEEPVFGRDEREGPVVE